MAGSPMVPVLTSTDDAELDLARQIQSTFLPGPCYGWPGVRLAARRLDAGGLGGDFHDAFRGLDEQYLVAVGTIQGPGMAAALAKTLLSGALRKFGPISRSPRTLMDRFQRLLSRVGADLKDQSLRCSVFVGTIDCGHGVLEYCLAGGYRPRVWTHNGASRQVRPTGPALGRTVDAEIRVESIDLTLLRRLVVCSDGLASALSPDGEPFGLDREQNLLRKTIGLPAGQQAETILHRVREYVGPDRAFPDDVTVLVTDFLEDLAADDSGAMAARLASYERGLGVTPDPSVFLG